MAIGDNFDTTPPGFTNQTTLRKSGHGRISQYPAIIAMTTKGIPAMRDVVVKRLAMKELFMIPMQGVNCLQS